METREQMSGNARAPGSETYEHGSDIGVRGRGASREAAFANAALAMMSVVTQPSSVLTGMPVRIECEAGDDEMLLVEWLDSLIYEMATRRMLFSRFDVTLDRPGHLIATAWGEPVDRQRHHPAVEIKGTTLTTLRVAREADGQWLAQCVVDV